MDKLIYINVHVGVLCDTSVEYLKFFHMIDNFSLSANNQIVSLTLLHSQLSAQ